MAAPSTANTDQAAKLLREEAAQYTLLLGILIAVSLPSSADWAIGLLVGIDFLFYGVTAISLAGAIKRAPRA